MLKPAFLVEGQMEQAIVQKLCPGVTVRTIGCNGRDVSMGVVAKTLNARLLRLQRYSPVIIILDREQRAEERAVLLLQLAGILDCMGFAGRYILGMPDRNTEVWTLSDWEGIRKKKPDLKAYQGGGEGINGKSVIKKLLPNDTIYSETTLGVELFCSADPITMYKKSQSFRDFIDQLSIPCHWLAPLHTRFQPAYMCDLSQ